jgi:hypothetical protein
MNRARFGFSHAKNSPLTLDPIFSFQKWLLAEDGEAYDEFGCSVALSGDTAVIGAMWDGVNYQYQGSAYVFVRDGNGWTLQQKLTASDGEWGDHFGASVAISDGTLVVGAIADDIDGNDNQGSVYVFTRNGMVWTEQQKLTAHLGEKYDQFGNAVALSGDAAIRWL